MKMLNWLTDWKSFAIGVLTGKIILLSSYIYFQGQDYRNVKSKAPLSVKEVVGTLPNGDILERYVVPYRGRFHYVYVTETATTINKPSVNGRTTNMEATVHIKKK
jgi:hypothetical protein